MDGVTCCACMSACARGAAWQAALGLLEHLSALQLRRSVTSYNASMHGLEKAQRWRHVLELVVDMGCRGLRADAVTRGVVTLACDRAAPWTEGVRPLLGFRSSGRPHCGCRAEWWAAGRWRKTGPNGAQVRSRRPGSTAEALERGEARGSGASGA